MQLDRRSGRNRSLPSNSSVLYALFILFIVDKLIKRDGKIEGMICLDGFEEVEIPKSVQIQFIPIDKNVRICAMHYRSKSSKYFVFSASKLFIRRRVLLYSHGNAIDIGAMVNNMIFLSTELDCDIISYDYEGYGYSNGVASSKNLPRDLMAVYKYALEYYPRNAIYLIGESSIIE